MCSRMLYTILPSPYSDENLNDVLEDLSSDLLSLYRDGIKVSHILVLVRLQLFSPQEKFQYSFMSAIGGGVIQHLFQHPRFSTRNRSTSTDSWWLGWRVTGRIFGNVWAFVVDTTAYKNVTGAKSLKLVWEIKKISSSHGSIARMAAPFFFQINKCFLSMRNGGMWRMPWRTLLQTMILGMSLAGWVSPLRKLPTADDPKYIRIDPAHTYAIDGIGKSYLASSIILLMHMGWFGNGSIDDKFKIAFSRFMAYCEARGKNTSITEFSHKVFKLPQNSCLVSHCKRLLVFLDCPVFYIHFFPPLRLYNIPMFRKSFLYPSGWMDTQLVLEKATTLRWCLPGWMKNSAQSPRPLQKLRRHWVVCRNTLGPTNFWNDKMDITVTQQWHQGQCTIHVTFSLISRWCGLQS